MRKFVFAATVATLGLAGPALAQDGRAPFTGLRAEGLIGYDVAKPGGGEGDSDGVDGVGYGAAIGYDQQVGGVVLGAEGEISDSTTKARVTDLFQIGDRARLGIGRDLYVGGRVGFVISPMTMAYAKAGYTNARINARYEDGVNDFRDHVTMDGFRFGAGLEQNISTNAYVKGEYRYSNYGELEDIDTDIDRHQLMLGFGMRF